MEFLEALVPQPQGVGDYKKASFEFNAKDIHLIDQMELHKQTGEMVASTLTSTIYAAGILIQCLVTNQNG